MLQAGLQFWDRIVRPEQLMASLPQAMRVLTDPADTGAVTLALPQDVQAEAYDYPAAFFAKRVHHHRPPSGRSGRGEAGRGEADRAANGSR